MGRVTHFEVTAEDTERARKFYAAVFGWKMRESGMPGMDYTLVNTGDDDTPGINGAIMPRSYRDQAVIVTGEVDDLELAVEALKAAGGKPDDEAHEIPGVGRHLYAYDTEGNLFALLEPAHNGS